MVRILRSRLNFHISSAHEYQHNINFPKNHATNSVSTLSNLGCFVNFEQVKETETTRQTKRSKDLWVDFVFSKTFRTVKVSVQYRRAFVSSDTIKNMLWY